MVIGATRQTKRCFGTAQDIFVLDSAFALIEGHPQLIFSR
jgi:hypothetical protein